jgi:uncharacterized delta-60 repeat protein
MRKLWLGLVVGLLASASIGAGSAQARLDSSFGQGGVVAVEPPLPAPWMSQGVQQFAAAPDGSSFALVRRLRCAGGAPCVYSDVVVRYAADGSFDPTFGSGSGFYELPQEGASATTLSVDALGRPLLAETGEGWIVVRRLTSFGAPDPGFGSGGVVTLGCECQLFDTRIASGPRGSVTVAAPLKEHPHATPEVELFRLTEDGALDARFGRGGTVAAPLPGYSPRPFVAESKRGTVYLGGTSCCGRNARSYLVRVSIRGRYDGRFAAAARRSLRFLAGPHRSFATVHAVVARRDGRIDLLGRANRERGFVLRLDSNGHRNRSFGRRGVRMLPSRVSSAAPGSEGSTLALTEGDKGSWGTVTRILAGGRLDPSLERQRIPGSQGDLGLSIAAQAGKRALVMDLGEHTCRGLCEGPSELVRFLEGPPKRR